VVTPEKPFPYGQFNSQTGAQPNSDPFVKQDPFAASDQPKNTAADPFSNPQQPKNTTADPFSPQEPKNTAADLNHHYKGSLIGGLVLITIGTLFIIDQLVPNVNFGDLWPVILVVVGGGLLFNALSRRK
jgi:hypothetical protein